MQFMGLQRVGHNLATEQQEQYYPSGFPGGSVVKNPPANAGDAGSGRFPWRRKWHPTPVLLPGESHGLRSLVGYIAHGVTKSWSWLSGWAQTYMHIAILKGNSGLIRNDLGSQRFHSLSLQLVGPECSTSEPPRASRWNPVSDKSSRRGRETREPVWVEERETEGGSALLTGQPYRGSQSPKTHSQDWKGS